MDAGASVSDRQRGVVQSWGDSQVKPQSAHSALSKKGFCQMVPPQVAEAIANQYEGTRKEIALRKIKHLHTSHLQGHGKPFLPEHARAIGAQKIDLTQLAIVNVYVTDSEQRLPGDLFYNESLAQKPHQLVTEEKLPFIHNTHACLKSALRFLLDVLKRNSYDGKRHPVHAVCDVVNTDHEPSTNNAVWNGEIIYVGEGDQTFFTDFARLSILGHELIHAVVQEVNDLEISGPSGAICEHYCDIIASMICQYFGGDLVWQEFTKAPTREHHQTVEQASWVIGAGVLRDGNQLFPLRSLSHPGEAYKHSKLGQDIQVKSRADAVPLPDDIDYGGIHRYSGFLNKAFYLAATKLGGYAWDHVGKIWWDALPALRRNTDYEQLARATLNSAKKLFGVDSKEYFAVLAGWRAVDIQI